MGCNNCPDNKESVGLGDSIAKAIQSATFGAIKPCDGCKKRKDFLNRLVPYNNKSKVQLFMDHIKDTVNADDAPD
tara:strand:- start:400 stop:624 length:225 start_codon:yes stop_codon:yes gene_type:complete